MEVTAWAGLTLEELLDHLERAIYSKVRAATFSDMQTHNRRAQLIRQELHNRCQ